MTPGGENRLLKDMDILYIILGLGLLIWAVADLVTGQIVLLPTIHSPGTRFTREDDGPIYYLAVAVRLGAGLYFLLGI